MVEILWAISNVVFPWRVVRRLSRMIFSVLVSAAETESSRIRMGASFSRARAMHSYESQTNGGGDFDEGGEA